MTQNCLDQETPNLVYFVVPGKNRYFGLFWEDGGVGQL